MPTMCGEESGAGMSCESCGGDHRDERIEELEDSLAECAVVLLSSAITSGDPLAKSIAHAARKVAGAAAFVAALDAAVAMSKGRAMEPRIKLVVAECERAQ